MAIRGITTVRNLVSGGVAVIAAWSSYSHMVHLVLRYGERPEVAYALPFSVDGMLLVSTIVMVDDKRRGHGVRPVARLSFVVGVAASVAANIAAAHPTPGARIIDAWPALALLLVVEMLARPPADATPAPEQATVFGPEHRDVPVAAFPSGNANVPPAKEVPARYKVAPDTELPPAATVPPEHATAHAAEAAPLPQLPALPCLAPANSRPPQRHLQSVPHANDVRTAEATPAAPTEHDGSAACVPVDPQIAVPPEPLLTDGVVPAEPRGAKPRPVTPRHPVPAAAEPASAPTRSAAANQHQSAESRAALRSNGAAADSSRGTATSAGKITKARRSASATRALAQSMMRAEPHLTKTEIAHRLEISTRRLRDVLAS